MTTHIDPQPITAENVADIQPGAVVVFKTNAYVVVAVHSGTIARMHEAHGNNVYGIPFNHPDLSLLYRVEDVPPGFSTMEYIHGGPPLQYYS